MGYLLHKTQLVPVITRKLSCRKDNRAMHRIRMGALKIFGSSGVPQSLTTLIATVLKIFNGLLFRLSL